MFEPFCLALAIYVEARGEPIDGQLLVAEVVINRSKQTQPQQNLCSVVFADEQFSGINDSLDLAAIFADDAWKTSEQVAYDALEGKLIGTTATHYHTLSVDPYWAQDMVFLGMYGNHYFYRDK